LTCLGLIGQCSEYLYILCITCTYTTEMPLWLSSLLTTKLAPCNPFTVLGPWENQWHSLSAEAKPRLLLNPLGSPLDLLAVVPLKPLHFSFNYLLHWTCYWLCPSVPIPSISVASLWTPVWALYSVPFVCCSSRPGYKRLQLSCVLQHFPEHPLPGRTLTPALRPAPTPLHPVMRILFSLALAHPHVCNTRHNHIYFNALSKCTTQ
jgi:hypothetical protein